ncbi:MBL fold metallo-hydrolase [Spirillospora sp. NPDC029432]|uniref:MBL fold metallo-hydrolase n=1 Tax=Spirillospora sp. NPDC029432 TaxID=3154599 RepID=UPI003454C790
MGTHDPTVTFVGNATTIIRYGGFTLLTDPNFLHRGERVHLGYGLTSKRLKDPALTIDELPELDAVLLSHLHDDHWDRVAEDRLDRELPVLTTPAAARTLRRRGFARAHGMGTWRHRTLTKDDRAIRITAMPGRHGPAPFHRLLPPVMGTLVEFGPADGDPELRLCISGDTVMYDEIAEIGRRHPGIDAGIVHLGGTTLLGMLVVTMDGAQGASWVEATGCASALPVHYDDYTVMKSPLSDFEDAMRAKGLRLRHIERGETLPLARTTGR